MNEIKKTETVDLQPEPITKKDLRQVFIRQLLGGQLAWNYERMQGICYCYTMIPILKKLYKDPNDMRKALKLHNQFFNTNPYMTPIIQGVDIAVEEKQGIKTQDAVDAIVGIKMGLMGPFAGIGDTIFGVIVGTVFGAIASYMGLQGLPVGVFIWFLWNIARIFINYWFIGVGYKQGTKIVTTMSGKMQHLTVAASILGLTVVGALITAVVSATVPATFVMGEVTMGVQGILDQIMPGLIPVVLVAIVYWMLGLNKMTSVKTIWIVMAASIILYNLGILV